MKGMIRMSLTELRKKLDSKEISVRELTEEYLKRIEEKDKSIRSYITVAEDTARREVDEAQKLIDKGESKPLTGIPLSVKDNICTKGIRTTCASRMLENFKPVYDATVIEKLKEQGAVFLGKTNMDEFAMGGTGRTSYFGGTRNPYDLERVAGGSSSGAAASVSAGLCAAALGSDTGGSVRQPAAFCGVTGLKPTYGAVSRYGLIAFASSLDQIGVVGNSARDAAYVLNAIAGQDERDATSRKLSDWDSMSMLGMDIAGIKIGIPKEFFSEGIADEVKEKVMSVAKFYESKGAKLINTSMPSLDYAVSAYYLISSAEAASNLSRFDGIKFGYRSDKGENYNELIKNTRREGFGQEVKRRILLGNYALSSGYYDAYYKNALRISSRLKEEYNGIFKSCDVILTPTAPATAQKICQNKEKPATAYLSDICTVSVNIAGLPGISTTCGYDENNMPIGMSIVGRHFDEARIVAVADVFEREFSRREPMI